MIFIFYHDNIYKTSLLKQGVAVVVARMKVKGKHYEMQVDLDEALKVKSGKGDIMSALISPHIYHDIKKGTAASKADLMDAFATEDAYAIAKKIILGGEVQKNQEFRDMEKETKVKQLVYLLVRNSVDQYGRPYTEDRIKRALEEVHYHPDRRAPEQQISEAVEALKKVIPIKLETKRIKLTIPAQYTGQVYSILKEYKESEDWLPNGSLSAVINIPAGMQLDFYDKLNSITHGAVQSVELGEKA